jgi:AraC-like DNA-binding protein
VAVTDDRRYVERLPRAGLDDLVACTWIGRPRPDGSPHVPVVLPDACIDLVWSGGVVVVAGPDTRPVPAARTGRTVVGLRFRPGAAPAALGVPASALLDARVPLDDVVGPRAAGLAAALDAAPSPSAAIAVLETAVTRWREDGGVPDPLVAGLVAALRQNRTGWPVAELADTLGLGVRQLHRRTAAAVGYGPKVLDRVLRFRRFLALRERRPGWTLADLAVESGYADQAHLARECRALAGVPPSQLPGPPVTTGDLS